MNWEVIGTVAEVAAAIGVIISLFYLAHQVRQSNKNDSVTAAQEVIRDYANHLTVVMSDENSNAFIKGLKSYGDLTATERYKFDFCMAGYINMVEVVLYHNEAGRGHEILEMVTDNFGPRIFAYPGAKEWWNHGEKAGFARSTQEWVDVMFERNASVPGFWEYGSPDTSPKSG